MPVALVLGGLLGGVSLLLQVAFPGPVAMFANTSSLWALAAFAYGAWVASASGRTAVGGAVLLVTGIVSFYLAAAVVRGDAVSAVWSPWSLAWAVTGVVAGSLFATVGSLRIRGGWWTAFSAATAGGVCLAECVVALGRPTGQPGIDTASVVLAALLATTGVLALVATARTPSLTARAALLTVPLAVVGYAGFDLVRLVGAFT